MIVIGYYCKPLDRSQDNIGSPTSDGVSAGKYKMLYDYQLLIITANLFSK